MRRPTSHSLGGILFLSRLIFTEKYLSSRGNEKLKEKVEQKGQSGIIYMPTIFGLEKVSITISKKA